MKKILLTLFMLACVNAFAQQTIRGTITDKQSKSPLFGVVVMLVDSTGKIGTTTDEFGEFRLSPVPLGRQTIKFVYMGYAQVVQSNILVQQGKESFLTLEMEEEIIEINEVVVKANADKTQSLNEMATNSTRQFSVEETSRYAGSLNDPSRMAANFAGVSGANDGRNDIVIRGNSPIGLLWRLDGMPIPNPNHFSASGTTGGPISMLNYNLLANSDFMTSAFPAEYGNAVSGVFDLNMRTGNNKKREHLVQVGFNGFEAGTEGYFSKKSRASYLINYRYSTLGVFQALGMNIGTGTAVPQYQDASFKVDVPIGKKGRLQFFGVGGVSYIELLDSKQDTTKKDENLYGNGGFDQYFRSNTGMLGTTYSYFFNANTSLKLGLIASGSLGRFRSDSLNVKTFQTYNNFDLNTLDTRQTFTAQINRKISVRNSLHFGTYISRIGYNTQSNYYEITQNRWRKLKDAHDAAYLTEVFGQVKHKFNTKLTMNAGLHAQYFNLGNAFAIEPRIGIKYQLRNNQALSMATGIHSQVQPMTVYAGQTRLADGSYAKTNTNLGFTKAYHAVLGYDVSFLNSWRVKLETYVQLLRNVPVETRSTSFSMLNVGADFYIDDRDSLVNKGKGINYGVELTLEKFLSKGFYTLMTTSLYQSKYEGSDGVMRNTAFNGNYVVNLLIGKEFKFNSRSSFLVDYKMAISGGKRYNPIDLKKSKEQQQTVFDDSKPYVNQREMYFRPDIKLTYRRGSKNGKFTQELGISLQNFINHKNIFTESYDKTNDKIVKQYQQGFLPIPQYRIIF